MELNPAGTRFSQKGQIVLQLTASTVFGIPRATLAAILSSLLLVACGGGSSPDEVAGNSNRAPLAVADVAAQDGGELSIAVLANDRDPDGDALTLSAVGSAGNGTVVIDDNGTAATGDDFVRYTPSGGYGGNDSFSYTISDPFGLTATALVTVQATSTAPVANSDDVSTASDTPVSVFVLANDSDPNGLTLNLVSVTASANGVAVINDNGTPGDASDDFVDYGPNTGFSGSDSFSYTVTNGAESASATVNVIVGGTGSQGVSGDVTKGPIKSATIRLYRLDGKGLPVGSPVAQTATNAQGKWTVAVPLPREPLLVVSEGGQYVDETDSNPDPTLRRVIQLSATDQLEGVLPGTDDYLALNLYTNAMLMKSRSETVGSEFMGVYANNHNLLTQAMGFDPVTTAPTDPGNPNPGASDAAKQYALLLGGAANVANAVVQASTQNMVAFNVLTGFINDMQDCRLDGVNQDGAAQYLFLGAQQLMPTDLDLNLEITRFRNNNFASFAGITASVDESVCSQSGAIPDTIAPVITLLGANPITLEGGPAYVDAGFTATDDRDGDVSASVTVTGSIDTTTVGTQTLTFSATDAAGNVGTATRTVTIIDTTPPVFTLLGTAPVTVLQDTSYVDSGATALDAVDGDVTADIVTVNPVDISTPGTYLVTYDVTDSAGNAATQLTRLVIVVDTTDPVITVNGNSPETAEAGQPYIDAGASAYDFPDGDLTASIVTVNNVNTAVIGSYTVTYDVTDSSGNPAVQQVRTVNVVDSTAPVITLNGSNPQIVEAPSAYTELGATASDSFDGDISASIVIDASAVDTTTPGSYVVTYNVSDGAGNAATQVTRTVIVADTTAPVITLTGANPQTLEVNTAYTELGATANDSLDGDLTASIVIDTTALDPTTVGSYTVTYNVNDAAGNAATQVTRTVNVVDTTPPVITLTGANPQVIEALNAYTELGATASDNLDGDLSASIVIDASAVDTSTPGSYVVTYDVMDAAGNAATQVTRTVTVQDTTAPAITLNGANPQIIEAPTAYTELGATASDTVDGDISASIVIDASAVDTTTPGSYVVTYDVIDAAGNAATQVTRTVTVQDTTAPVITLTGANPQVIEAPTAYIELGATASDTLDGDVSASIVIDASAVNTSVPGSYVVSYDVVDAAGNAATQVTRTVTVQDTTPPVITLTGTNPQNIVLNDPYVEQGATASDSLDGDVSASIVIDASAVDTNTQGSYPVTYDVMDAAGNPATQVVRTVIVGDTTPPVITLVGADPLTHEAGTPYADPGATANDNVDGDITASIVTGGSVDTTTIGDYVLTYDVTDTSGNPATQVTRTVQVRDTTSPVISLVGSDPLPHEAGTPFTDPGATANDSFEGDLSGSIVTGGTVDETTIGDYVLTYDVTDGSGNAATQVTRTVQVRDTVAPTLTLISTDPLAHEAGTPFSDPGATANDSFEGDLTASIVSGGTVDETTIGDYVLTYDVSDGSGNAAPQLTRLVQVRDTTAPVITLLGANPDTVAQGSGPYSDPGATANDAFEGDLTASLLVTGVVDTTTIGTYVLGHDVSDGSGNAATTVSRTINVVAAAETVDSDGDGLSDAIETAITGSPTATQANTFFIDPDPSITVRDGTSWATAYAGIEDVVAANGGFIPAGTSPAQPTYLVLSDTSGDPATLANPDKYQLVVANGTCSHIAFVGSMGSGTIHPGTGVAEPTTILNRPNARILNANNCANLQFYQLQLVDSGGTGIANGGAVQISNIDVVFDGVFFRRNQATVGGGALEIGNGPAPTVIRNSVFEDNDVEDGAGIGGGAIMLANNSWADISDTSFINNSAEPGQGGAIYAVQNADLQVTRSLFAGNDATTDGGAIFIERNNVSPANEISHSVFSGNKADREGGAIYELCNGFAPSLRFFNNLFTANAALRGGAFAIDDCDATGHDSNTLVFNEATAANGGGAMHIDTVSLAAPNFRPMPDVSDNVFYGNIDAGGVNAYSINNLPGWDQQESHENLMDDAASTSGNDLLVADPALEFEVAWYLIQASSQAIDLSKTNAANASKFLATPERVTDRNGVADAAKADAGYHYTGAYPGDAISVTAESQLQGNDGPRGQDLLVIIRDGMGDPLTSGYRVAFDIVAGSAPVNLKIVSFAPDPLAPVGTYVATDVGGGQYKIVVDTNGVPGPDNVTVDVYVDGVFVGQVVFPVNP